MTLLDRVEARAEATRGRALSQGLARLDGSRAAYERYEFPDRTLVELVRSVRLTKIRVKRLEDGTWKEA